MRNIGLYVSSALMIVGLGATIHLVLTNSNMTIQQLWMRYPATCGSAAITYFAGAILFAYCWIQERR